MYPDSRSTQKYTDGYISGPRIPKDFFETKGKGESDISVHSGSYHIALQDAGIGMCNIMAYSSILPGTANKIGKPDNIVHGSVLESIISVSHAGKGVQATAGILYRWLYSNKDHSRFGGLVCEHNGSFNLTTLISLLNSSLEELYENGFSNSYELGDPNFLTESFIPQKKYGTALASLCFTSWYYPVIKK